MVARSCDMHNAPLYCILYKHNTARLTGRTIQSNPARCQFGLRPQVTDGVDDARHTLAASAACGIIQLTADLRSGALQILRNLLAAGF